MTDKEGYERFRQRAQSELEKLHAELNSESLGDNVSSFWHHVSTKPRIKDLEDHLKFLDEEEAREPWFNKPTGLATVTSLAQFKADKKNKT